MSDTKERKVLFSTLIKRNWKSGDKDPFDTPLYEIDAIISFVLKQSKTNKFFNLKENKFCFLESAKIEDLENESKLIIGLFKSARNEFRPDLINKKTGTERKNPKEISEGDIEKNHFVIRIDKVTQEVYLFLEYNFHGINLNSVVNYFGSFNIKYLTAINLKRTYSVKHFIIPREDFRKELDKLTRTKLAEVYIDKKLLGSKALKFSNRYVSLKQDLKLVASASPRESITEVAIDFFNAMTGENSDISKIRIYGNDENNNDVILDTSFMSKVEFIEVDLNPDTGEVNSTQLFSRLKEIAINF